MKRLKTAGRWTLGFALGLLLGCGGPSTVTTGGTNETITVNFNGTGTLDPGGTSCEYSGSFVYYEPVLAKPSGSGVFPFAGLAVPPNTHSVSYVVGPASMPLLSGSGTGNELKLFTITTDASSNNQLLLNAIILSTGDDITITLTNMTGCSTTALPFKTGFTAGTTTTNSFVVTKGGKTFTSTNLTLSASQQP